MSDEVWNICMDGMEQSPYFELVRSVEVPNKKDLYLKEQDSNTMWLVDMRRETNNGAFGVPEQLLRLVQNTFEYHTTNYNKTLMNLKVLLMDWQYGVFSVCQGWSKIQTLCQLFAN
jgi:hypothetical protein